MNEHDYYGIGGSTFTMDKLKRSFDLSNVWKDDMYEVRNHIASEYTKSNNEELLRQLEAMINAPKKKSKEERVVDIIKGGFENHFNMTIQEFQAIYEHMLANNPEKLV